MTASFQPEQLAATPGEPSTLSLHLQNNAAESRVVSLSASGELGEMMGLATESVQLEPGEHFEVPVIVQTYATLAAGPHACVVDVVGEGTSTTATAFVEVGIITGWTARLLPVHSAGSTRGRHKVAIENHGNAPITLAIAIAGETDVVSEVAAPTVNVDGGMSTNVALRIIPGSRFWNGPSIEHPFSVTVTEVIVTEVTASEVTASEVTVTEVVGENVTVELDGLYEQRPRIPAWAAPAAAGMLGALLIATLAWYTLMRPAVENIARDEAAELDLEQQALLDERVDAIEEAAEEASRLPLGQPTDLRMTATASTATTSSEAYDFDKNGNGRVLSISDVIFQNPTGAVGRLELLRDDQVLLDQELANFRDLDFHLVAPFRVESESTIALRLTCEAPGPGTSDCEAAATIIGFVDDL
ncbi:hypothetical protein [Ilumatobacter sp.]|uniref:COG1470 family protein n=1 Tax=Ilumatobacter sp. TaxID=1967498 RepID=UPI003C30ED07